MSNYVMKITFVLFLPIIAILGCQTEQPGGENYKSKELTETGAANDISEIRATLTGYANPTPEMGQVEMGILYSLDSSPSLENGTELKSVELDGNNMYKVSAVDLSPGTTYYFKSFVMYGGIYRYGNVKSFRTLNVNANIVTNSVTDIGETKATINGKLTIDSRENLSRKAWILYSDSATTIDALKSDGKKREVKLQNDGSFSVNVTGLLYGANYNYVSIAEVQGVEITESSIRTFSTQDVQVTLTTEEPTRVEFTVATLAGKLSVVSEEELSKKVYFLYSPTASTLDGLKTSGKKVEARLNNDGTIVSYPSDLQTDTKYYYVAMATVNNRDYYGTQVKSFKTAFLRVNVYDATEVGTMRASMHGRIETDYKENFREIKARFLYGDPNNFVDGAIYGYNEQADIAADGTVSQVITGLDFRKQYKYYLQVEVLQYEYGYRNQYISDYKTLYTDCIYYAVPVDLGLSVKWADRNLGASAEDDFGSYIAWGEIEPKDNYAFSNYKWHDNNGFNKYVMRTADPGYDGKLTLEPADDAASVKLKGTWRTPTREEVLELQATKDDTANYEWTSTSRNGIKGVLIKYKKNGNTIFFPATMHKYDTYTDYSESGRVGYYWTSTVYNYSDEAYRLSAGISSNQAYIGCSQHFRWYGNTVRPVCK